MSLVLLSLWRQTLIKARFAKRISPLWQNKNTSMTVLVFFVHGLGWNRVMFMIYSYN